MDSKNQQKNVQRPQTNDNCNGPRVSFNKDVHVKRIGNRSNEIPIINSSNIDPPIASPQPPYKRELPQNLSKEELIKEAEHVLAQSERIRCTADTPHSSLRRKEDIFDDRKFNSLPHRKKKTKQLNRSVSDATQKKSKRPSIFNLFSKRSDPNINLSTNSIERQSPSTNRSVAVTLNRRTGKPVGRSKSDVGYQRTSDLNGNSITDKFHGKSLTLDRKRNKNQQIDSDDQMSKQKKKSQLSPISENPPGEKYFGFSSNEQKPSNSNNNDIELLNDNNRDRRMYSQSVENLHSSQIPQEKLPLTKGVTVDGMVKRLSMERFSPPPTFTSPAFSYTRPPTGPIVYAQVLRDENGDKSTARRSPLNNSISVTGAATATNNNVNDTPQSARERRAFSSSPTRNKFRSTSDIDMDTVDYIHNPHRDISSHGRDFNSPDVHRIVKKDKPREPAMNRYRSPDRRPLSDEDEGIGFDSRRNGHDDDLSHSHRNNIRQSSCEPPIIPKVKPSYGSTEHLNELSNRRKLLENKIHDRSFGAPKVINHRIQSTNEDEPRSPRHRVIEHEIDVEREVPLPLQRRPKYYPETNVDDEFCRDNDTIRREQERLRHKKLVEKTYLNGSSSPPNRVIDLGYIDQYHDPSTNYKYPNVVKTDNNNQSIKPKRLLKDDVEQINRYPDRFSTLEREKQKYRSFDKGDSGIENDDRNFLINDSMKNITEIFLRRERRHADMLNKRRYDYRFRERSIDDGSHYDPRLDKFPNQDQGRHTLTRPSPTNEKKEKSEKKFNSLKRMKEMLLPSRKSSDKRKSTSPETSSDRTKSVEKSTSPIQHAPPQEVTRIDIATRRRLSTPKASPIPDRNLSQKSSKVSRASSQRSSNASSPSSHKPSWFKSLERLSRKSKSKKITPEPKPSPKLSPKRNTKRPPPPVQQNLRFFGDTDLESISKGATNARQRKPIHSKHSHSAHNLTHDEDVPRPTSHSTPAKMKNSTSMQQIGNKFRSKYLADLSESTSENENGQKYNVNAQPSTSKYKQNRPYHSTEFLENDSRENSPARNYRDSSMDRHALRERNRSIEKDTRQLPPTRPIKPAREFERKRAFSNSGTEGDSSQSQSVVYLHATTVGHIPQPYVLNSRRSSKSRDELNSTRTKSSTNNLQPMTRTVSRSVSMLAPWTPKHIGDGYEINYSQTMQNNSKKKSSSGRKESARRVRSRDDSSSLRNSSVNSAITTPSRHK